MTTAAYRHAIDAAAAGRPLDPVWRAEVDKVSHRHYSTGFYYGYPGQHTDSARYIRDWQVLAVVTDCDGVGNATLSLRNKFAAGDEIEVVGPDVAAFSMTAPMMADGDGMPPAGTQNPPDGVHHAAAPAGAAPVGGSGLPEKFLREAKKRPVVSDGALLCFRRSSIALDQLDAGCAAVRINSTWSPF